LILSSVTTHVMPAVRKKREEVFVEEE